MAEIAESLGCLPLRLEALEAEYSVKGKPYENVKFDKLRIPEL